MINPYKSLFSSPTPPSPILTFHAAPGPVALVRLADIASAEIQPPAYRRRKCYLQVLGRGGHLLASVPHRSVKDAQGTLDLIGKALIAAANP